MRVLVSIDMEGIAGVVDPEDIGPGQREYERNRALLTAEAKKSTTYGPFTLSGGAPSVT